MKCHDITENRASVAIFKKVLKELIVYTGMGLTEMYSKRWPIYFIFLFHSRVEIISQSL